MSIFKRLLGKKNIYFKIVEEIITSPENWDQEALDLVEALTKEEKETIIRICKLLHKHLEHHFDFWTKNGFAREMIKNDISLLYKSYFELLMIDWILISNNFKKKQIRYEVGKTLFKILYYSLNAYSKSLFSQNTFRTYELAFENRSKLYPKILTSYFSGNKSKSDIALQNIYTLVVANPLTNDISNLDYESPGHSIIGGTLDYLNWEQNMRKTISFIKNFSSGINIFSNGLEKIISS